MQDITKNNFDFLRFVLALIVFFGHIGVLSHSRALAFLSNIHAEYAVYCFFIISGFLIARSYDLNSNVRRYFTKRWNRIIPAYWFVIASSAILLSLLSRFPLMSYFSNIGVYKYVFWNALFLNFKAPNLPGVFDNDAVNGALWTMKIEVSFYILLPICFVLWKANKKWRNWILLVIYLLSVCFSIYFNHIGNRILARQIPGSLCYFVAGMFLYFNFAYFIRYKTIAFLLAICLLSMSNTAEMQLLLPILLGVIILFVAYSLPFLNHFGKYGDCTYGIYIFHFPIIKTITTLGLFDRYNPFLVSLSCIAFVILIGFCCWHFFEKRFLN